MNESSFLLVGNGSYLNKGCEAIVRGTTHILQEAFGDSRFYSANFDVQKPAYMPKESNKNIIHQPIPQPKKWSPSWAFHQGLIRTMPDAGWDYYFRNITPYAKESKAVLSIGGDNYSLDYSIPKLYIALDDYAQRQGNPLIIWGASIGPFDSNPEFAKFMHKHLNSTVKAIFVREKRSLQYLHKYRISNNVHLVPDPAFVMVPESCGIDEIGFNVPDGAVGINLSPQIKKMLAIDKQEKFLDESVELVARIQKKTGLPVVLIPHVTSPHSNDYALLLEIYQRLNRNDVYLIPPHLNAAQTKYIISKLAVMVAARTHATIGAFSTCVPTVSLAYSMKAHGINEMLFGHQDFVVPIDEYNVQSIENKILHVLERSDEVKDVLSSIMKNVKADAMASGHILKDLLEN